MTEHSFKAPPLPRAQTPASQAAAAAPKTDAPHAAASPAAAPAPLSTQALVLILAGVFVVGLLFGKVVFGGAAPVQTGLSGVILNPDLTQPLPRCGNTDQVSACVLYIMNHTRYDRLVEDFFDDAVRLTGRQKFLISIENTRYAKSPIRPGHFVQLKIPAIR